MASRKIACIILAAGKGVRMKSELPKVMHKIGGREMVLHSVDRAIELGCDPVVAVLGNGAELARKILPGGVKVAIQEKQLGTGHAAQCAMPHIGKAQTILILYGDTPLLTAESLNALIDEKEKSRKRLAILTAKMNFPNKLGRIIRKKSGQVEKVVEVSDATKKQLAIEEINAGIYVADTDFLKKALDGLKSNNAQGEFYLTDVVAAANKAGGVAAYTVPDYTEVLGVNDRIELAAAEKEMNRRTIRKLMTGGVTFIDPDNAYIQSQAAIGADTIIYPGGVIEGKTIVGKNCTIEPGAFLIDAEIGDGVQIKAYSVVEKSKIGNGTNVGPSAHIRPDSVIGANCRIGNFVETKKAEIGDGTKASHLTYLGDAQIGKNVNIGCGTITCNYDGVNKYMTIIEDDVFVGSDTQFVAPVRVGKGAYIGSGSTITKDVAPGALAVTRAALKEVPGGGARMKNRKKEKKREE